MKLAILKSAEKVQEVLATEEQVARLKRNAKTGAFTLEIVSDIPLTTKASGYQAVREFYAAINFIPKR